MSNAGHFSSGDQLGRYELVFPAGKGGMGQVWAAKLRGSQGFRKIVALKTLLASEVRSSEMQSMLRDEAMLASHVKSPHVAETLDFDMHQGVPFLVMEWVDGESLADLLDELDGPLSLKHVVAIVTQALKGLDAAHRALDAAGNPLGLVHRDVSPPNILVSYTGLVKLADFGIAKVTAQEQAVETGLKGKFNFMSPEQVRGTALDARTDLFAMSVLMYRLVTGQYPFAGADPGETLWQISSSITPRRPRSLNGNLPPRVEEVILKGLEKEPNDRHQSAQAMLAALENAVPPPLRGNSEEAIAELMKSTLGERMEQRRRETARALLSVPPGAHDPSQPQSISTLKGLTYSAAPSPTVTVSASSIPRASKKGRGKRRLLVASVVGAMAGLTVMAFGPNLLKVAATRQAGMGTHGVEPLELPSHATPPAPNPERASSPAETRTPEVPVTSPAASSVGVPAAPKAAPPLAKRTSKPKRRASEKSLPSSNDLKSPY